ncbi:MAG: response regulator transcription factor [Catalinimonas sp.]
MTPARLLLVEDDESLGFLLTEHFEAAGYRVVHFCDGLAAREAFEPRAYTLAVFDVMLPRLDGFALAEHVRRHDADVPLLFLTAREQPEDRLRGFRLGGDDYVTKPFSLEELDLRVRAILRRTSGAPEPGVYHFGRTTLDHRNLRLECDGHARRLTQREADLLRMLARHPNQVVARERILKDIWGEEGYFVTRSMDVFVSRLRKYLRPDPTLRIRNVHGVGFCLEAPYVCRSERK